MSNNREYSPVDRASLSADDAAHSLLCQEEKHFTFERKRLSPAQRFKRLALRSLAFFVILLIHAGLVLLLARWIISGIPAKTTPSYNSPSMTKSHGHGGHGSHGSKPAAGYAGDMETHKVHYTVEGVPPVVDKDVEAEFSMINPCGSTAEEARARGCRFGVLYGAWLPEQCWDDETEERFKAYDDWKFYLQPNRTEELTWDQVAQGDQPYYLVEWQYHQRHCAEMARRFFTAVSRRGLNTIDSYLSQWAHTDHCAHSVMEWNPTHELMAILQRKFPDCGLIRWKN
ncbi:hypothetical protein QBC38DRAFT_476945 [Podospora fimiseda]|uniref:Uncharacterized protein n=1 Tax=Podospora fimiseda TaxID=252190 RepID=A0AAN7BRJ4_9PEZI|nr:hypothetical protein QBC38DRAFT_476945 [Podospora fimiseda]